MFRRRAGSKVGRNDGGTTGERTRGLGDGRASLAYLLNLTPTIGVRSDRAPAMPFARP